MHVFTGLVKLIILSFLIGMVLLLLDVKRKLLKNAKFNFYRLKVGPNGGFDMVFLLLLRKYIYDSHMVSYLGNLRRSDRSKIHDSSMVIDNRINYYKLAFCRVCSRDVVTD